MPDTESTSKIAIDWAISRPWPGRAGALDQRVYLAHAKISARSRKPEYHASTRDIAETANVSRTTASASSYRLAKAGLITLVRPGLPSFAAVYSLCEVWKSESDTTSTNERNSMSGFVQEDVFAYQGLGGTCGQLWAALSSGPKKRSELVTETGRHDRTIRRALAKMARLVDERSGEIVALVDLRGGKWCLLDSANLARAAELVGVFGGGRARHERHKKERAANRHITLLGRRP